MKFKTYKVKHCLGALGDFTAEYWNESDWDNYHKYIKELKASGDYLKEVEYTYDLIPNKELDGPFNSGNRYSTAQFIIFDI